MYSGFRQDKCPFKVKTALAIDRQRCERLHTVVHSELVPVTPQPLPLNRLTKKSVGAISRAPAGRGEWNGDDRIRQAIMKDLPR